jgi:hypothetical protein
MKTITVHNHQEDKDEAFTPEQAFDWLETIGLHAAYEMYAERDVAQLMNFMRPAKERGAA